MGVEEYYNIIKPICKVFGILFIIGSIFIYFLAVVNTSNSTSGTLAEVAVKLFVGGIILFIIGKIIPKSKFFCDECNYIALTERELINHHIVHDEEDDDEEDDEEEEDDDEKSHSKYLQCKFCSMYFEKEVEKLNHQLTCKKKQKQKPDKKNLKKNGMIPLKEWDKQEPDKKLDEK